MRRASGQDVRIIRRKQFRGPCPVQGLSRRPGKWIPGARDVGILYMNFVILRGTRRAAVHGPRERTVRIDANWLPCSGKIREIRSVARRVFACRRKRKRGARPVAFRPSPSPVQGSSEKNFVSRRPGSGGTIAVRLPPSSFSFVISLFVSLYVQ